MSGSLAALPAMSLAQMHTRWMEVTGKPVPRVRRTLLRLALAWEELQAAVYGGLSRRIEQRLDYLAGKSAPQRGGAPGTRWSGPAFFGLTHRRKAA